MDTENYVMRTAEAIGLTIPSACAQGTLRGFDRLAQMAAVVLAHQLADETESAQIFSLDHE